VARLKVAPIVEGHGEVPAVPILSRRVWTELLGGEYIDVLKPIRQPRYRLATNKDATLDKAIALAVGKLSDPGLMDDPTLILILLDADEDLPCELGPKVLQLASSARSDHNISCVIANVEYETWFVAAADSLSQFLSLADGESAPADPEAEHCGKGWIKTRFRGTKYSKPVDQPKLTAHMDLSMCRLRCPSFDKRCRDLEGMIGVKGDS
jgi:hypothetical protein